MGSQLGVDNSCCSRERLLVGNNDRLPERCRRVARPKVAQVGLLRQISTNQKSEKLLREPSFGPNSANSARLTARWTIFRRTLSHFDPTRPFVDFCPTPAKVLQHSAHIGESLSMLVSDARASVWVTMCPKKLKLGPEQLWNNVGARESRGAWRAGQVSCLSGYPCSRHSGPRGHLSCLRRRLVGLL